MLRKDYRRIAPALSVTRPVAIGELTAQRRIQWEDDCRGIAGALHRDNPAFKPEVFFKACGLLD